MGASALKHASTASCQGLRCSTHWKGNKHVLYRRICRSRALSAINRPLGWAPTRRVKSVTAATGRHRVPEWTAEQAKRCLSPRSGRVLFAPQASRNAGNPKDGFPAAPRHPWRRGICASVHGRANAFAYFSRKKSRSGARRRAHQINSSRNDTKPSSQQKKSRLESKTLTQ